MAVMAAEGAPWRLGRRPALDGLRGAAVLLVMLSHVFDSRFLGGGAVGVTVFFVLSGFLITSLLLEEHGATGRLRLGRFYWRRALRLFPAMWLMVCLVALFEARLGLATGRRVLAILLYVGNWVGSGSAPFDLLSHTWSLAVEEQFYLVWPLVLAVLLRRCSRRVVVAVCLGGAAVSTVTSVALWVGGASAHRVYCGSDTRAGALLAGCALATFLHGRRTTRSNRPVLAAVLLAGAGAVGLVPGEPAHSLLAPTVALVLAAPVLWLLVGSGGAGVFGTWWMRYLGRRSYGLYLWHVPLVYGVTIFSDDPVARFVAVAVTFVVAEASWRYLEQPLLRLRERPVTGGGHRAVAASPAVLPVLVGEPAERRDSLV
jgi:peptidoglycan/LPS O-acetylase OafA/YrhL